jgi:CRP/FNR family transcriptional regulator, anaerobic regulatory protein
VSQFTHSKSAPGQLTIFSGLSEQEVQQLDALSTTRHLEAGAYLLHQHTPARQVFMLEEGVLMMERSSATGKRQIMAFIYPGNFIGFTHNEYYEFSVQSLTRTRFTEIPSGAFIDLQEKIPQLKLNVRQIGGNVLAHALDQVFALGQKKAHERVCFLLRQLLERSPDPGGEGKIELVMTRQDIGDYLGLTIETVSRAFARLKKEKIIDIHSAHTVRILDMEQLSEMALAE